MSFTRIIYTLFIIVLWAIPARNCSSVEYTFSDSFPVTMQVFIVAEAGDVTMDEAGLLYILCEKSKEVYVYLPKKG